MGNKLQNLSLQGKISTIYLLSNLLVLIVNITLLLGINSMSNELDIVYQKNLHLNELTKALDSVQNSMTDYLNAKTTDALEDYYRSEQNYSQLITELNNDVTVAAFGRMERNIKHMSENYLEEVSQTIEAKRGRNVEKYRKRYEHATQLYQYINAYIYSLNNEQFEHNSQNYNELSKAFRLFETISSVIMLAVIIGNISIILKLAETIISPLKILAGQATEVAKGNFNIELLEIHSTDEIGVVTRAFNQMFISICQGMEIERTLKEKELMMEAHLKDAQLKYLQAQINPHFLFNTLNAGAQLAMMEDADRTYEYVQNVAEFFRYNVKKGNDIVTIREEIELVDNYIYILNVRFSGDIHYEKKVDKSLLNVKMPSMILQPIVENCINHGIREMAGRGRIHLNVYKINDTACISIRDNGIGMTKENIRKVLTGSCKETDFAADSNGIGMDNVIARLKLFTESDDVMTIVSEGQNQGTEFIIYLQIKEREVENV